MAVQEILLLGNPKLYKRAVAIRKNEIQELLSLISDMHDTLMNFRKKYGVGRAIAAPQINVAKRLVYMHIDEPVVFINPVISYKSRAMIELWDDCMSFPNLLVRVRRHQKIRITFHDMNWVEHTWEIENKLSELLQHECDHLEGILAVSRAIDGKSFALRNQIISKQP